MRIFLGISNNNIYICIEIFYLINTHESFKLGFDRILFWPDTGYPPDYLCRITGYCNSKNKFCYKICNYNTIKLGSVRMYVCPSKHPCTCLSVRPTICNMYELLLTYCYSTKNVRNYAFVSLFKRFLLINIKDLIARYPVTSWILKIAGFRPNPSSNYQMQK